MKKIAVDASSAILLYKAELFDHLMSHFSVVMSPAVRREITKEGYEGAADFERYFNTKNIIEIKPDLKGISCRGVFEGLNNLHEGEFETIILHMKGESEAVLTDDGPGAKLCKEAQLPYINALLIPRILFLSTILSEEESEEYLKRLIVLGRYSDDIITFAVNCQKEHVSYFLPDTEH